MTVDPTMSDQVAELADRVTRLRDGIEALQPRTLTGWGSHPRHAGGLFRCDQWCRRD